MTLQKTSPTGDTDQSVYKRLWKWNGIYHMMASDCRRDAEKLNGLNK